MHIYLFICTVIEQYENILRFMEEAITTNGRHNHSHSHRHSHTNETDTVSVTVTVYVTVLCKISLVGGSFRGFLHKKDFSRVS